MLNEMMDEVAAAVTSVSARFYAVCFIHLILCIYILATTTPGHEPLTLGGVVISPEFQWANGAFCCFSVTAIIAAAIGHLHVIQSHLMVYQNVLLASMCVDGFYLVMFVIFGQACTDHGHFTDHMFCHLTSGMIILTLMGFILFKLLGIVVTSRARKMLRNSYNEEFLPYLKATLGGSIIAQENAAAMQQSFRPAGPRGAAADVVSQPPSVPIVPSYAAPLGTSTGPAYGSAMATGSLVPTSRAMPVNTSAVLPTSGIVPTSGRIITASATSGVVAAPISGVVSAVPPMSPMTVPMATELMSPVVAMPAGTQILPPVSASRAPSMVVPATMPPLNPTGLQMVSQMAVSHMVPSTISHLGPAMDPMVGGAEGPVFDQDTTLLPDDMHDDQDTLCHFPLLTREESELHFIITLDAIQKLSNGEYPVEILGPSGRPLLFARLPEVQAGFRLELCTSAGSDCPHGTVGPFTPGIRASEAIKIHGSTGNHFADMMQHGDGWAVQRKGKMILFFELDPYTSEIRARGPEGGVSSLATAASEDSLKVQMGSGVDAMLILLCMVTVVLMSQGQTG